MNTDPADKIINFCSEPTAPSVFPCLGQHLFTKDGRKIGNAIIIEVTPDGLFRMETDFGNTGELLNAKEIEEWWHTTDDHGNVRISEVCEWRKQRARKQSI